MSIRAKKPRIAAIALVVAMIFNMVPTIALAANIEEDKGFGYAGTPSDYVDVQLMAAKSLYTADGSKVTGGSTTPSLAQTLLSYRANSPTNANHAGYNYETLLSGIELDEIDGATVLKSVANDAFAEIFKSTANALFQDETNGGTKVLKVSPGDTFYVAVNFDAHLAAQKGTSMSGMTFLMDTDVFSVSLASNLVINHMLGGKAYASPFTLEYAKTYLDYVGNFAVESPKDSMTISGDGTNGTGFSFVLKSAEDYYTSPLTDWEFLVPVTVSATAKTGTYYINPCDSTTASKITVGWSNAEPGTSGIASTGEAAQKSAGTLKANSIKIEVTLPASTDPGPWTDEEDAATNYTDSVTNIKNAPYAASTENDTLTFATGETGYTAGSYVAIYGNKVVDNIDVADTDNLLGMTVIPGTAGDPVGGITIDLLDENGAAYIKGEDKVWLALQDPEKKTNTETGKEEFTHSPSEMKIKVSITPEVLFFDGDVEAFPNNADDSTKSPLGSSDNPVKINLGGSLQEALNQVKASLPATVTPVLNDGSKPSVNLDWVKGDITADKTEAVEKAVAALVFNDHGSATIRLALPNDANGTYTQPIYDNGITIPDGKQSAYGAVIYASVSPKARDYFVTNKTEGPVKEITIYGDSRKALQSGDIVKLYTAETGGQLIEAITVVGGQTTAYTIADTGSILPAADNNVYLTVTKSGTTEESTPVRVPVTKGTPVVTDDVVVNSPDDQDGVFYFEKGTSVADVMTGMVEAGYSPVAVDVTGLETAPEIDLTANALTWDLKKGDAASNEEEFISDGAVNKTFTFSTVIPEAVDSSYANPQNFTISFKATPVNRIHLDGTVAVAKNSPFGEKDEITITGDQYGEVKSDGNYKVTIYKGDEETPFTEGVVTAKTANVAEPTKWDYVIKVDQLGREATTGGTFKLYINNPTLTDTLGTKAIAFDVTVPEAPTFQGVKDYAVTPLKLDKADYADIDAVLAANPAVLPDSAVIEYAYLRAKTGGGTEADPDATYTQKVTLTGTWAKDGSPASDGTVTLTQALGALPKTDGTNGLPADIEIAAGTAAQKASMPVRILETAYEEPSAPNDNVSNAETKIANNPYPQKDTLTAVNVVAGQTIAVYKSQTDSTNPTKALCSFKLAAKDIVDGTATLELPTQIGPMAGSVWVTIDSADTLPCAAVEKGFSTETYVFWNTNIHPVEVTIKTEDVKNAVGGAAAYVKKFLPEFADIVVVHLQDGATPGTYEPIPGDSQMTSVAVSRDNWHVDIANAPIMGDGHFTAAGDVQLFAQVDPAAISAAKVVVSTNGSGEQVGIVDNLVGVPARDTRVNFKVTLKDDAPSATDLPDPFAEHYITLGNKENTDPTDDEIKIDLTGATPPLNGSTVDISYPAADGTIKNTTGTLDANGVVTLTAPANFDGFNISGGTATFRFASTPNGPSPIISKEVPKAPTSYSIAAVTSPMSITMFAGTVKTNAALGAHVKDIKKVWVTLDNSGGDMEVNLKAADGTNVDWVLQVSTNGTDWSAVDTASEGWATALASKPAAGTSYRLMAELDTDATYDKVLNATTKVATVAIALSDPNNKEDQDAYPLQLAAGNSDLWLNSTDPTSPAGVKLAALLNADSNLTKNSFKYDTVFWYRYESHDTDIAPYLAPSITKIGNDTIGESGTYTTVDAWMNAKPGRNVIVTELDQDGAPINRQITLKDNSVVTLNEIEPRHVVAKEDNSDSVEYFELNVTNGMRRGTENYKISYTVIDGDQQYTFIRNVKLCYKPGDANLDGAVGVQDAGFANQYYTGLLKIFRDSSGNDIAGQSVQILDLNEDGAGGVQDAGLMLQVYTGLKNYPFCRY